jgi:CheY-like chemotaxis protein
VTRALVVDDNPHLLSVLAEELRAAFEVIEASTYAEAAGQLQSGIAAIVTDLDLGPGNSGLDLLREARARRPEVARVLVTGSAGDQRIETALLDGTVQEFFSKPWRSGAVRDAVAKLFQGTPVRAKAMAR